VGITKKLMDIIMAVVDVHAKYLNAKLERK
jgi:hypothetical protein